MYKLTNMSLQILEVFLDTLSRKNMQKFKINDGTRMSCTKFEPRFIPVKGKIRCKILFNNSSIYLNC